MSRRLIPLQRLANLGDPAAGLTSGEVLARRREHGRNDIIEVPPHPWRDLALETAKDPMIWFLLGTAALYGFLGGRTESVALLVAIVPLVAMDAFLHRRTQASTSGLSSRLAVQASVMREGRAVLLPAGDLVPGDLVIVGANEAFPADGILIEGSGLQADESTLTGEAYPIHKIPVATLPSNADEALVESEHLGFAGTRLLTGRAFLRVVFTGRETLYGEIVQSAVKGTRTRTPLQAGIDRMVSLLIGFASLLCLVLALVRVGQGYGWLDGLVSAVTLAVAALPEEFPVVFTFFLAVGVYRLARRQALVRRAVSVESIGRVSTICSDKTGTMTEGRLRLTRLIPSPDVSRDRLLRMAALASRQDSGDPLDAAVLLEAEALRQEDGGADRLAVFPFTEDRRRETVIVRQADGSVLAATKGSPEVVAAICSITDSDRAGIGERVTALAGKGHKVLAVAWRSLHDSKWGDSEPSDRFEFAGLLECEDPVRDGVAQAIARCRQAGIHPMMVTGDHPATAEAVAREIGLGGEAPRVITGGALEAGLSGDRGLDLRAIDVVARAVPGQKLALVRALQNNGEVVAVTGDGVNDVPALQAADIGIAMGERGTRSAREVAAIVLMDDNFRTIVEAIAEGRRLFRNLKLSFTYLLTIHIPLVLSAAIIPLAGYPLLYLPIHIVWLEIVIHPTAMLVFQDLEFTRFPASSPPRGRSSLFSAREWMLVGISGGLLTLLVAGGYVRSLGDGRHVEHARSMALAALMVASALTVATLSRLGTRLSRAVAAGTLTLLLAFLQVPILARPLHVEALHLDDWILAVAGGLIAIVLPLGLGMSSGKARKVPSIDGCPRQPRRARAGVESHPAGEGDR